MRSSKNVVVEAKNIQQDFYPKQEENIDWNIKLRY